MLVASLGGLSRHAGGSLLVWLEGPYGQDIQFETYEQVLLVATGISIAAHLSYLRLLVETSLQGKRSKDIFVAWEIQDSCACET